MLRCENVKYTTSPPRQVEVFKNLDFKIEKGENTVIYGDNGSGKSTLLKLLLGIEKPDRGEIADEQSAVAVFEDIEEQILFSTVREELKSSDTFDNNQIMSILKLRPLRTRSTLELSFTEKSRLVFFTAWQTGKHFMLVDTPVDDDLINKCIKYLTRNKKRTVVLFLPVEEKRSFTNSWQKFYIDNKRINIAN
ncbi:MAG: ATP-binding cassette domain-containing protein [Elusimicrobiota bacterium]